MKSRWGWSVDPSTGCWNWSGVFQANGYGIHNRTQAHRAVYEKERGPIPDGLVIDHLCRNRACVNPDHLEPVTTAENIRRGMSPHIVAARTDRCLRGHDLSNAYLAANGYRQCRECGRLHHARYRQAKRMTAEAM